MRILVTGARDWRYPELVEAELVKLQAEYKDLAVCAGGCLGADTAAMLACRDKGIDFVEYPANWKKYDKAAGPIRNKFMLKHFNPSLVLAFHDNLEESKGTKDMVSHASKEGCTIILINSKGERRGIVR